MANNPVRDFLREERADHRPDVEKAGDELLVERGQPPKSTSASQDR